MLRTHIQNCIKTRDAYTDYRKAGYSAKFRAGHESEILPHQAAKRAFDELSVKRLLPVRSCLSYPSRFSFPMLTCSIREDMLTMVHLFEQLNIKERPDGLRDTN